MINYVNFPYIGALILLAYLHKYVFYAINRYFYKDFDKLLSGFFSPMKVIIDKIIGINFTLSSLFLISALLFFRIMCTFVYFLYSKFFYKNIFYICYELIIPIIFGLIFSIFIRSVIVYSFLEKIQMLSNLIIAYRHNVGFLIIISSGFYLTCTVAPIIYFLSIDLFTSGVGQLSLLLGILYFCNINRGMFGIITKVSDAGADLYGKVDKKLKEDSFSNPFTILDTCGDLIGDLVGSFISLIFLLSLFKALSLYIGCNILQYDVLLKCCYIAVPISSFLPFLFSKIFKINFSSNNIEKIDLSVSIISKSIVILLVPRDLIFLSTIICYFVYDLASYSMIKYFVKDYIYPYFKISLPMGLFAQLNIVLFYGSIQLLIGTAIGLVTLFCDISTYQSFSTALFCLYILNMWSDFIGVSYDNLGSFCSFIKDDDLRVFTDVMDNQGNFNKWATKNYCSTITLLMFSILISSTYHKYKILHMNYPYGIILPFMLCAASIILFFFNIRSILVCFNDTTKDVLTELELNGSSYSSTTILNKILSSCSKFMNFLASELLIFSVAYLLMCNNKITPLLLGMISIVYIGINHYIGMFGFLADYSKKVIENDDKCLDVIKDRVVITDVIGDPMKDSIAPYMITTYQLASFICIMILYIEKFNSMTVI